METVACPDCDLLQHLPELPPGGKARCPRCNHTLATQPTDSLDRTLALTLTAAIVLIVANTSPLMGLSAVGRQASTTIIGGAYEMWLQGQDVTAMVVAFCAVIAPASYILFMLTVLIAVRRPPAPRAVGEMLRWAHSSDATLLAEGRGTIDSARRRRHLAAAGDQAGIVIVKSGAGRGQRTGGNRENGDKYRRRRG